MPGCAAYQVTSTLTSLPLGFTLRKCTGGQKKALALTGHVSSHTTNDHKMPYKAQILCKTSQHAIKDRIHTWFPGTVPKYGTRWAQM